MATVTGPRGTGNMAPAQRKIDMSKTIALLEPRSAPLTRLLNEMDSAAAVDPKIQWVEDTLEPRYDAINMGAGAAVGITALIVDNGAYFAAQDIFQVTRTGENIRVVSVATNTLTVVRGVGVAAAAINDNDELVILGSAQPEGDISKPARSSNPATVINYLQIHTTPIEATETQRSSDNQTSPHDWDHQANKAGIEHAKDKELTYLFGRPSEDLTGSQPRRTSGGVLHYLVTNQTDAGGQFTNAEFNGVMQTGFRYPGYGSRKVAFASATAVRVMNQYAQDKIQIKQGETSFGLNVTDYISPFGTLRVFIHPLLEGAKYGGYLIGLDLGNLRRRYLNGGVGDNRDTHIETNIQQRDQDTRKDQYKTEDGLEVKAEKTHFLVSGITS